ncbi:MAG: helix-turn-helix domain-containing protein [Pseudonocardiaceae bacterium]
MGPRSERNRALADARQARRLTQAQLAERVSARLGLDPPLDGNYISKLERGVHTWPNADYRRAFREELGAKTDAELGFHCSRSVPEEDGPVQAFTTGWHASEQDPAAVSETATPATLRWLILPTIATTPSRTGTCRQVGHGDVARLRIARSQLKTLDDTMGGGAAYPMTRTYLLDEVPPLLNGSYTSEVGVELLTAVAELNLDLGWMAYDAGHQNRARRHMLDSLRLSDLAHGRSLFGGRVLAALSHQALHLGRPSEALDLASAARASTSGMAAPSVTAMCAAMEACALAATGDHAQCESTLSIAETALSSRSDGVDPSWLDFDEGGLWGHAARAYRDLGLPRQAKDFAEDAIALCRPDHSRTRAQRTAILATALAQLGEVEEAAEAAQRVVADAWRLHSRHVLQDVSQLLDLLGSTNAASVFTEHAHDLLAARSELFAADGLSD